MAYVFLLRVPSEGLPAVKSEAGAISRAQSVLCCDGTELLLHLGRRKNKRGGSILRRRCWCKESAITCPIHSLWPAVSEVEHGQSIFADITADRAVKVLREVLEILGVKDCREYATHDFRRGHAEDLRAAGATLREILEAGEWRSPAFLKYLDLVALEMDMVVQAHLDESEDEHA